MNTLLYYFSYALFEVKKRKYSSLVLPKNCLETRMCTSYRGLGARTFSAGTSTISSSARTSLRTILSEFIIKNILGKNIIFENIFIKDISEKIFSEYTIERQFSGTSMRTSSGRPTSRSPLAEASLRASTNSPPLEIQMAREYVKKMTTATMVNPYLTVSTADTGAQVIILGHNHLDKVALNISCTPQRL